MKYTFLLAALMGTSSVFAQDSNTEAVVRKVADNIIQNTSFKFVNTKTNETYESTKGLASSPDVKVASKFNKWMYVNGVLTIGMMQMADVLKDKNTQTIRCITLNSYLAILGILKPCIKQRLLKRSLGLFLTSPTWMHVAPWERDFQM